MVRGEKQPAIIRPKLSPIFDMDRVWKIMDGAIDIHIHGAPDVDFARTGTELQMALQACEVGMAAVVFKCHGAPTSRSAAFIQEAVHSWAKEHGKHKTDVFGGVVLSYATGGLNLDAVIANARFGGKYVWLPSLDASFHRREKAKIGGGIDVLDENDNVLPALKEILSLVAESDMVLGICHQSTKERFILIDEAKKAGIKKIEIIHPTQVGLKMSVEELKLVAQKGAYIGLYCWGVAAPQFDADLTLRIIKEVGPARLVAGTDCGKYLLDTPVEAMRKFVTWMLDSGISDETVARIVKINARDLLY